MMNIATILVQFQVIMKVSTIWNSWLKKTSGSAFSVVTFLEPAVVVILIFT